MTQAMSMLYICMQNVILIGQRFAAALLPRLFGMIIAYKAVSTMSQLYVSVILHYYIVLYYIIIS